MRPAAWMMVFPAAASLAAAAEPPGATSRPAGPALRIFDGRPKVLVVNGYSTSFHWPRLLQRKCDRYFGGRRVLTVRQATKGGTPVAKWIDVETGRPRPAWEVVRRALKRPAPGTPVIALCQQSLQWVYGPRAEGIRGRDDHERIARGADALERYVRRLRADGADMVFLAMHIYKKPMEPAIGNERLALAALVRRGLGFLRPGPDVWTPTRRLYPKAFAADGLHPNAAGAEVMAHHWFGCLLAHDGLPVPAWSAEEMNRAIRSASGGAPRRRAPRPGRDARGRN